MNLEQQLYRSGIRPSREVIGKCHLLRAALKSGNMPSELEEKIEQLPVSHSVSIALRAVKREIAAGHSEFDDLTLYALAYVWEEFDDVPDDAAGGLLDDVAVIRQISKTSTDWGDLTLKSRRPIIANSWHDGMLR